MKTTKAFILVLAFTTNISFAQEIKPASINADSIKRVEVEKERKDSEAAKKVFLEKNKQSSENKQASVNSSPDQALTQQELSQLNNSKPGQMHKILVGAVGDWNQSIMYWPKPMESPVVSKSKCTISMIFGGRFQKTVTKGDMSGVPFEGQGIIGYDNALKKYQSSWMDNMGTGIRNLTGNFNEKINLFEFSGNSVDPTTSKEVETIQTIKMVSPDEMNMEMFIIRDGQKTKLMEINSKRIIVKKAPKTK